MPPLSKSIATLVLEQPAGKYSDEEDAQFAVFPGEELLVGRDSSICSPVIRSELVSKKHFRIYNIIYEDGEDPVNPPLIYCEDLESVNGTWVNDTLIGKIGSPKKGYLLSDRDLIQIKPHWFFRFYQKLDARSITKDEIQEAEKQSFANRYAIKSRVLGSGLQGTVYLAYDNFTQTQLACKIVDLRNFAEESINEECTRDEVSPEFVKPALPATQQRKVVAEKKLSKLMREVQLLSKLNHPNVVSLKKAFLSRYTLYLFQELATGGDLFSYLQSQGGTLDDLHSRIISRQVALAIQYLHAQGIAHRDLKPENILVTHTDIGHRVLLTDFDLATSMTKTSNRHMSLVGTPGYMAPEINLKSKNEGYTKAIDMWSLGIVTTCLLTGDYLEDEQRDSKGRAISGALSLSINNIVEAKEQWAEVGVRARDFVRKLLVTDPEKRMTADEAVNHYWFTRPKEVAVELKKLYERANKHWSPRQETNLFEHLPDVCSVSEPSEVDGVVTDPLSKSSKRRKRLHDSTASPYFGVDKHLRSTTPSTKKRKLQTLQHLNSSSQMFMQEAPSSKHRGQPAVPAIASDVNHVTKTATGSNLFGQDLLIDLTDSKETESENEVQSPEQLRLAELTSQTTKNMANLEVLDEIQDSPQKSPKRDPISASTFPSGFEDSEEMQDGDSRETADTQESQEIRSPAERHRTISELWTQKDQQVYDDTCNEIPAFSSAKLLRDTMANRRSRS